jgi:hypothetical protein
MRDREKSHPVLLTLELNFQETVALNAGSSMEGAEPAKID